MSQGFLTMAPVAATVVRERTADAVRIDRRDTIAYRELNCLSDGTLGVLGLDRGKVEAWANGLIDDLRLRAAQPAAAAYSPA